MMIVLNRFNCISFVLLAVVVSNTYKHVTAAEANYDESKVPEYSLPNPLQTSDGSKITTSKDWIEKGRPEVLELFRKHVYGRSPGEPNNIDFDIFDQGRTGNAIRKQVELRQFVARRERNSKTDGSCQLDLA